MEQELPEDLKARYMETLPQKISELEGLIEKVQKEPAESSLAALRFWVHKTAGSSGLYGYQMVSDLCKAWDERLLKELEKPSGTYSLKAEELSSFLESIKKGFQYKRVLLVDDDEDLLRIVSFYFKGRGFETKEVTTGAEALSYIADEKNMERVALVVLDRLLPDADGLDILAKIREKYKSKVPVLILSVLGADKDVLEGLKKGALDYVGKPFNPDILMQKAMSLISTASSHV